MFVAERFPSVIVNSHGKHRISTDRGTWYPSQACRDLGLRHHIRSLFIAKSEKSMIERKIRYIKDRTEGFDDYFPCRTRNCKLKHVINWMNLFVKYLNKKLYR